MFTGHLLEDVRFVQVMEQNWIEPLALKNLGSVFTSDKHGNWILGEVMLRFK